MTKEVNLTHKGLSRLGIDLDFELKTDNMKSAIKCSKSQISFISPIISKLLQSDPTINEFRFKTKNSSKCSEIIQTMLNGSSISITEDVSEIFYSIALELGNQEILTLVEEKITKENVTEMARIKYNLSLDIEKETEFIASHFYEIPPNKISSLDISLIDSILGSKSLIIKSEHRLFGFINGLISTHGEDYQYLLSHLHFEYLEAEDVSMIISFIDENNIGCFLPSIFRRLIYPLAYFPVPEEDQPRLGFISIPYKGDKFEGIFSHLREEVGNNPLDEGIVSIEETTSTRQPNISYLVDPEKRIQTYWWCVTKNKEGGAFIIDFKDMRVALNGYSLKAHSRNLINESDMNLFLASNTGLFIKSWKIEGSNDKMVWTLIDEQISSELQSFLAEGFWQCQSTIPFRYFRIMMTDKNSSGNYQMALHAIELFGSYIK